MEKKVTSRCTSINKRVPAIAKLIERNVDMKMVEDLGIYDLGCGKYPEYFSDWCTKRNIPYVGEDKHQFDGVYNGRLAYAMDCHPVAISSNVLNVLPERQRIEYMDELLSVGTYGKPSWVFITVYEGNRTGDGKYRKDSFQANLRTVDMLLWLECTYPKYTWERKGKLIFAHTWAHDKY